MFRPAQLTEPPGAFLHFAAPELNDASNVERRSRCSAASVEVPTTNNIAHNTVSLRKQSQILRRLIFSRPWPLATPLAILLTRYVRVTL